MLTKQIKSQQSIVFSWQKEDFDSLLKSCDLDDEVQITLQYLHDKNANILEAGCGLGRVVKYLHNKGFVNVNGIELDFNSVNFLNNYYPELNVVHGDILNLPYGKNSFDIVLSYGVIEHFWNGPEQPLKALFDIIKPGGMAIVTVPSFNNLRKIRYLLDLLDPRKNKAIRKLFKKKSLLRNGKRFSYYIDPQYGKFFEYRFTPHQFESICKNSGFEIIKSVPIAHIDGLFHSFGKPLVKFENWKFSLSRFGYFVNTIFSKIPFLHNHMHMCVLKKV